jgi:DNA repair protein RadA/Sms
VDSVALFICLACQAYFATYTSWCTLCGEYGLIVPRGERPHSAIDDLVEMTTARALVGRTWTRLVVAAYDILLGPGALIAVTGDPGHGKSTLAVRLVDSMNGPVIIASFEEAPGPALAARLARAGAKREDLFVVGPCAVDRLAQLVDEKRAVALVIDSTQVAGIRPRTLRKLLTVLPRLQVLVAVSQQNKLGEISGTNELAHEADVVIACVNMHWSLKKSRFEPTPTEPRPILNLARADKQEKE